MTYEFVERGTMVQGTNPLVRELSGPRIVVDDPDRELVARWQGGDEKAFEELIERHQQRVYRLLYRMMGSREDAEDLTQETFLSLHRHGHRFRSESRFSTFIYRVAANAALNRRRALGRGRSRVEKLKTRNDAGDDLPSAPRDPEDAMLGGELSEHVRAALETLSPALRMPVVLYDIEGLAYGEIAKVLGVAEGTVKSRIHRARQALREELKGLLGAGSAIEGI
jgi:RNA polymerase sigma-70 factor (ECF subfamily)